MKDEIELLEVKAFKTKDGYLSETVEDAFKHIREIEFNKELDLFFDTPNGKLLDKFGLRDFLLENKNELKRLFDIL